MPKINKLSIAEIEAMAEEKEIYDKWLDTNPTMTLRWWVESLDLSITEKFFEEIKSVSEIGVALNEKERQFVKGIFSKFESDGFSMNISHRQLVWIDRIHGNLFLAGYI